MAGSTFKSGINYFSTYLLLVKDYIAYLGAKAIPVISGVVAASLVYPLPFAIMAAAVYAMLAGQHTSVINLGKWKFVADVDSAFLCALALAGLALIFHYLALRVALTSTTAWQTSLLWRAINQLPVMARWDTETAVPLPFRVGRLGAFLTSIVRSGFLIGRMVAIGLSSLVITLAALVVLAWLDPVSVTVLIVTAILILPLYAWALLRLVGVRAEYARIRPQQQVMLKQVLDQGVLAASERRIDVSRLSPGDASRFASGYAVVNDQLQRLNLISLILGLHVFASIAIIYVINGASLSSFLRDNVIFFVVLIFMLRATLSLVSLMSRLSRSYGSLATLRAYLHPRLKRVHRIAGAPADVCFALQTKQGERHYLQKGTPWFVVMPKATYAFELLPLSNGLQVLSEPKPEALRHIVFFDEAGLESFQDAGATPERLIEIEIPDKKQNLQLPIRSESPEPEQLFVVALSLPAWELLVRRGDIEAFCIDRIVFVIVSEPRRPQPPSADTLLVVSDGVEILAVGGFAKTWDGFAEEAFQRATKKEVKVEFEDEELDA